MKKVTILITVLLVFTVVVCPAQERRNWFFLDESIGIGFANGESLIRWEGFFGWENYYIGRIGIISMGYGQELDSEEASAIMVGGKYEFPFRLIKSSRGTNLVLNIGVKGGPMVGGGVASYAIAPSATFEIFWYAHSFWNKFGIALSYDHLFVEDGSASNISLHLIQSF